ncbi:exodeoxyribonuclease III [Candidatus Vallotia lariciata]|uniref:exodeoxyribonuclease III n=1 Tax=Candidatus Vallotia laricis TaxID=2018052 RepID=UPI001D0110FF|nr:exodeoxyribonuclease III [Candidatus Vallotia lariciata]UDG83363.1 Exodeoxyribonuclease [Candidatus Vallotia lariciata]
MLRVITANLNGIRSAAKKGFFEWCSEQNADIICVQEIRCSHDDMTPEFLMPYGFIGYFQHAQKKGYSGTGLYTKQKPDEFIAGFGNRTFDHEGRYVELRYGNLSLVSVYIPSGSGSKDRQSVKYRFMDDFYIHLDKLRQDREVIICGDINIVHKEIDIKNWKSNQKNSGCLPEERAWLGKIFSDLGYIDVFRILDPRPEQYTWWSNRGQAYMKNVGWRIDYQIATSSIASTARYASIFSYTRFSDHAPLTIDYEYTLSGHTCHAGLRQS